MDFIAGFIIGTILMIGITALKLANKTINKDIDTQPEFRPIATQNEVEKLQNDLEISKEVINVLTSISLKNMKEKNYWKCEAIKNAASPGEKLIAESKELCKKVDEFREDSQCKQ